MDQCDYEDEEDDFFVSSLPNNGPDGRAFPPPSPCPHNNWSVVRLRKAGMSLQCIRCGVRYRAERRFACSTYINLKWCGQVDPPCRFLHVYKERRGLAHADKLRPAPKPTVKMNPPILQRRNFCEMCGAGGWTEAGCDVCQHAARPGDDDQASSEEEKRLMSFLTDPVDDDNSVEAPAHYDDAWLLRGLFSVRI